jgi:hypothetical protein
MALLRGERGTVEGEEGKNPIPMIKITGLLKT